MLGDKSTLKTALTIRYISGFFLEELKLTIGVDFYSKTTNYEGKKIKLQIWDFGGEERFRFLLSQYCKGANAAMFLYDITNPITLQHLPDWTAIIREHAGDIPIMLIGSRLDLEEYRAVPREEGINVAKNYGLCSFVELSAKTGQNVESAFKTMVEILYEIYVQGKRVPNFQLLSDINSQIDKLMNLYYQWALMYNKENPLYISQLKKVLKAMEKIKLRNPLKLNHSQGGKNKKFCTEIGNKYIKKAYKKV
jgi:small GTP-binding protein